MKNVCLNYTGNLKKVKIAVTKANEILSSVDFYNQIRAYKKFDNSSLSPEIIARLMQESGHEITIKVNWIITSPSTKFDKIILPAWDFSDNLATGVNTIIYETVNSIDSLYNILNDEQGDLHAERHTACWVIGAIAEVMVK
jgi:hypothetical protein